MVTILLTGEGSVAGCYEHGNEPFEFHNGGELVDQLKNYQFFNDRACPVHLVNYGS